MSRKATFSKWWKIGGISIYGKNEGENCTIAEIETERFSFQKQDVDDCARLIASAPDLLEQCKLFEKCLTHLINSGDSGADLERDNLRAILDKVDGGEG